MRVGIDVGPLTPQRTGVGNYCFYLLKHLLQARPQPHLLGYAACRHHPDLGELAGKLAVKHRRIPTRAMYKIWDTIGRPRVDRSLGGVDVFHATNYFLPPTQNAMRVLTIHDLAFLIEPAWCSPRIVGPFSRAIKRHAPQADAIMVYSESTKSDIVRLLDVAPERIHVAPMAVDEQFQPMPRDEAEAYLTSTYGISPPFLLFVSTLEPRKNVSTLLRAFKRLAKKIPHTLVMIGSIGWNARETQKVLAEVDLGERLIRPGFVPHMKLPAFYCAADAFVFPTHYEGFGLPLLEALVCGCPVVTADNSSIPEVTGGAALMSHALDMDAFCQNVLRIVEDAELRESLRSRGLEHAKRFSWRACADKTLDVYEALSA